MWIQKWSSFEGRKSVSKFGLLQTCSFLYYLWIIISLWYSFNFTSRNRNWVWHINEISWSRTKYFSNCHIYLSFDEYFLGFEDYHLVNAQLLNILLHKLGKVFHYLGSFYGSQRHIADEKVKTRVVITYSLFKRWLQGPYYWGKTRYPLRRKLALWILNA